MFRSRIGIKGLSLLLCILSLAGLLGGCSVAIDVENMLTPPRLSAQQEQIYQALADTTGSGIRLKYPRSGSYLSSFIIADIDGDEADEAIVFYEYTGVSTPEEGLRINVLDRIDGQWLSVCDRSAQGAEIEKVILSPLGSHGRMNIIIGCSLANQSAKNVSAYTYTNNYLELTFSESYSLFDVAPTQPGGQPDLLLACPAGTDTPAYAAVYRLTEDGAYHEYKFRFADPYTDFSQMSYGRLPGGGTAICIDAVLGAAALQTEILSMEEEGFVSILERCGAPASSTARRLGLLSMDIDSDGMPEIPVQEVFQGYEDAAESERLMQTKWLAAEGGNLCTKYISCYSAADGYVFLLPRKWEGKATAVRDTAENELQLRLFEGSLSMDSPVLLRIYVAYDRTDLDAHLADGYTLFRTKGTASYLMRADRGSALDVPAADILLSFKFVG